MNRYITLWVSLSHYFCTRSQKTMLTMCCSEKWFTGRQQWHRTQSCQSVNPSLRCQAEMLHLQCVYIAVVCVFNQYNEVSAFYERVCYNVPPKLMFLFALKIKTLVYSIQHFTLNHFPFHITMLGGGKVYWRGLHGSRLFPMFFSSQSTINFSTMPSKPFQFLDFSISYNT